MGIGVRDHLSIFYSSFASFFFFVMSSFTLVRDGKAQDMVTSWISLFLYSPGGSGSGGLSQSLTHESCPLSYHHSAHIQLWKVEKHLMPTFDSGDLDKKFFQHRKTSLTGLFWQHISESSPPPASSEIESWWPPLPLEDNWGLGLLLENWRPGDAKSSPSRPDPTPPPSPSSAKSH